MNSQDVSNFKAMDLVLDVFMILKRIIPTLPLPTYLAIYLYNQERHPFMIGRVGEISMRYLPHSQIHLPTNIDGNARSLTYPTNSGLPHLHVPKVNIKEGS